MVKLNFELAPFAHTESSYTLLRYLFEKNSWDVYEKKKIVRTTGTLSSEMKFLLRKWQSLNEIRSNEPVLRLRFPYRPWWSVGDFTVHMWPWPERCILTRCPCFLLQAFSWYNVITVLPANVIESEIKTKHCEWDSTSFVAKWLKIHKVFTGSVSIN